MNDELFKCLSRLSMKELVDVVLGWTEQEIKDYKCYLSSLCVQGIKQLKAR